MHATMPLNKPRREKPIPRRLRVGPESDGKRMPLRLFAQAEPVSGYRYELADGVIIVNDILGMPHNFVVQAIDRLIRVYDVTHPGVIHYAGGSGEAKIEMWGHETERHPDYSIYLTPPPEGVAQPWDQWVPEIVIEVISNSSRRRDYEEKPTDYVMAGVREYWIIDPQKRSGLFLVRRVDTWSRHRLGASGKWKTSLLPEFTLDLAKVFAKRLNSKRKQHQSTAATSISTRHQP